MQCLRWLRPTCDGFRQCGKISALGLSLHFISLYISFASPLHLTFAFLQVVFITNCSWYSLAFTGSVLAPRQPRRTSQPYCFSSFCHGLMLKKMRRSVPLCHDSCISEWHDQGDRLSQRNPVRIFDFHEYYTQTPRFAQEVIIALWLSKRTLGLSMFSQNFQLVKDIRWNNDTVIGVPL